MPFPSISEVFHNYAAAMPGHLAGEGHGGPFGQLLKPYPLAQCFGNEHNGPQLNLFGPRQTI